MTQQYDRFNLEEEIQNVWQTKDDLNAITERVYDDPSGPMTEDEIGNVLTGLSELHETRCKKLWKLTAEKIVNKPRKIITFPPLLITTDSELTDGISLGMKKYIIAAGII